MPLARNWTFAVLWALAGLAPGLSWAGDAGAPVDFKQQKIDENTRKVFAYIGYTFDEQTAHIKSPDGSTLTEEKYTDLLSPFDFHKEALSEEEKSAIILGGCRLDEDSGHILCIDEGTQKKVPYPKISLEYLHKQNSLSTGRDILARMSLLLSKQDPNKPVPAVVASQFKAMLARSRDAAVPDSLVKAITAPGAKSGDAHALIEKAYTDSTRFFDGQQTLGETLKSSLPVVPGWNEPHRPPQFFDDNERKLGLTLRDSAQKYYAQSPIGQELLDHYKDKDGKVTLPPFLILKLDPREGAVYNYANKTVVVNQQYVVDGITANMPPGKDRDDLRVQLQDSKKFAAYMLAHPDAQDAFFKQHDVDLYHELTHGWQDRRDALFSEMERGNTPAVIHIEYEQEAFLAENRYMHWKVTHDPISAKDDPNLFRYMQFITNFDKFRDGISQQYLELFPKDAATLSTVEDLQKDRVGVARRLMGESLHSAAVELLKLVGMARGETEIARVESDSQKRTAAFLKDQYPQIQKEGYPAMVQIYLLKATSDKTPIERDSDLNSAEDWAKAVGDQKLIDLVKKAKERKK